MEKVFALFQTRVEAGRKLASLLERYRSEQPVVLALTKSGTPVAFEVARELGAPLDVAGVKTVRYDGDCSTPIAAVATDGETLLRQSIINAHQMAPQDVDDRVEEVRRDLSRRVHGHRSGSDPISVKGRTVILVDDGIHTDVAARLAMRKLRQCGAKRVVLAAPVCSMERLHEFEQGLVDDIVCSVMPIHFGAINQWYDEYPVVTDQEVRAFLERARKDFMTPISA